ncbi:GIN domain-containing protein [Marinigracilibium pacificum]|uniref:Putative auto-transporter adhesin head GIN domain-containing protein n=1 Tax=Marinigracilibium pacificum TaxID=2729599 RepID=A0A848J2Y9_9BACT|nr:DUF2807 domain-containing protein [Marinigracilibium pacificum]NMM50091.1 hypothetical protein [Marinigracilibium pacificum]
MRTGLNIFLLLTIVIVYNSCNDPEAFDCFKSAGDHSFEERAVDSYKYIILSTGVDVSFSDDQTETIKVEGPANLLSKIETTVYRDTLYITDQNTCSWVRSPVETKIHIPIQPEINILYEGYGEIELNTSNDIDLFSLTVKDGMGDMDINFANVKAASISNNSFSNINMTGKADSLHVYYSNNFGHFDASQLLVQNLDLRYSGKNDAKINPEVKLTGLIYGFGNVISINSPDEVSVEEISTGKLIFQN